MGETYIQATIISKDLRESQAEKPRMFAFRIVGNIIELNRFLTLVKPHYEIKDILRGNKQ